MTPPPRIAVAVAARVTYLAVQGGTSLLVFVAFARLLDPAGLDAAATALAVFVTAQAVADLGISQVITAQIPRWLDEDPAHAARLTVTSARLATAAAALTVFVCAAGALLAPPSARAPVLVIAPAAACALIVTAAESLARARGDVLTPVRLVVAARGTVFLALPLLLIGDPGATAAITVFTMAMAVGTVPAWRQVLRARRGGEAARVRAVAGPALGIGAAGALVAVGTRGNVLVLAHLGAAGQVGAFEAGWRVYQLCLYVAGAVATAMTPYAARALGSDFRRTVLPPLGVLAATGLVLGAAVVALAGPLVEVLLGDRPPHAAGALRLLGFALPVSFVLYYLQSAVAIPLMRLRPVVAGAVLLCAVTVGGTAARGEADGAAGAALAVLAGQVAMTVVVLAGLLLGRRSAAVPAQDRA